MKSYAWLERRFAHRAIFENVAVVLIASAILVVIYIAANSFGILSLERVSTKIFLLLIFVTIIAKVAATLQYLLDISRILPILYVSRGKIVFMLEPVFSIDIDDVEGVYTQYGDGKTDTVFILRSGKVKILRGCRFDLPARSV